MRWTDRCSRRLAVPNLDGVCREFQPVRPNVWSAPNGYVASPVGTRSASRPPRQWFFFRKLWPEPQTARSSGTVPLSNPTSRLGHLPMRFREIFGLVGHLVPIIHQAFAHVDHADRFGNVQLLVSLRN